MEKYLILNADDYGLSPSVNKGIVEAHRFGTITSATIIVNMPGFRDGVERALENPSLGVGLHFNLTYGAPVAPLKKVPSLINTEGIFSRKVKDWAFSEIKLELEAQWQLAQKAGLALTHLDGHQHIHWRSKGVAKAMASLALREKIPIRRSPKPLIKKYPPTSDFFIGDTYFDENGLEKLLAYLKAIKPGVTEIMAHPGYTDEYVQTLSSWTFVREVELEVFTNSQVKEAIILNGLKLINFSHLNGYKK